VGLEVTTNNEVEAMEMFQGMKISKACRFTHIQVVGDSYIIIFLLLELSTPHSIGIKRLIYKIQGLS
jgi:ribonuclease HI